MSSLKSLLPSPLYKLASSVISGYYKLNPEAWRVAKWEKEGRPNPPPHRIKIKTVKKYADNLPVFIETGTFRGDMVNAVRGMFKRIYSIELDKQLHQAAVQRFNNQKHIEILQGDSGFVMPAVLEKISEPVLFWLDGHYSGGITAKGELDTPIMRELQAIRQHIEKHNTQHVIMIDDANLFNGTNDYPTMPEMEKAAHNLFPGYKMHVEHNIIVLHPAG